MVIGGGVCSTSGALKQYRVFLLTKAVWWEIRRALLPQSAVIDETVWRGETKFRVDHEHVRQVAVFCCLYLALLAAGTLVITAYGYPLDRAVFEYASAQGTVGLSVGVTTPDAPLGVLWIQTAGMFLGRLEFFVVFIGLVKIARDLPSLVRRPDLRVNARP
jgi:trk system potassium uptake protein